MDRSSLEDLTALIEHMPKLAGALCRGSTAWDVDTFTGGSKDVARRDAAVEYAMSQCRKCPALSDCGSWLASLGKAQRPNGVVAGQLEPARRTRSAAPSLTESA
jgi:hypothetical protein